MILGGRRATLWGPEYSQEGKMYRRLLVPLDGSPLAETALPHASHIASTAGAELHLLRVTVPVFVETPDGQGCRVHEDGDRAEAERYLREWRDRLSAGSMRVISEVLGGNVAEVITDYTAATGTDLIVMSTHGRTGVRLWAYGSVAEKVLRAASCSVLVVRSGR